MKKLLLFIFFFILFIGGAVLAYTSTDVSNANFLADEGLIVKQSSSTKYRLDDTITRAEVVGIALKIKGVALPEKYTCKNYFSDVKYDAKNNWICRAVELAADGELVSRSNAKFRPGDRITRAEALAIIMQSNYHIPSGAPIQPFIDVKVDIDEMSTWWISDLVNFAHIQGVIHGDENKKIYFYPSRSATRAEVMGFAKKVFELRQQEQANGKTLKIENKNVVLYENGVKTKTLTEDGNVTTEELESCTSGQKMINYFLLYQSITNTFTYSYVGKITGVCEGGGGNTFFIFDGNALQNLSTLIENKYAITVWNGPSDSAILDDDALKNGRILVRGSFVYQGDCEALHCSEVLSFNKIAELKSMGLKVLQEPSGDILGTFEFEMSAITLTTY